jgi:hypothetical protein
MRASMRASMPRLGARCRGSAPDAEARRPMPRLGARRSRPGARRSRRTARRTVRAESHMMFTPWGLAALRIATSDPSAPTTPRLGARRSRLGARREHGSPVSGDPGSAGRGGRPAPPPRTSARGRGCVHDVQSRRFPGGQAPLGPPGAHRSRRAARRPTIPPSITAVLAARAARRGSRRPDEATTATAALTRPRPPRPP